MLPNNRQDRKSAEKKIGPLLRCECGFEILLAPDLKYMSKAIEAHAAEHGKKQKDSAKAAIEAERIENDLIIQTFKRIGNPHKK
jgi:hypothetical protein